MRRRPIDRRLFLLPACLLVLAGASVPAGPRLDASNAPAISITGVPCTVTLNGAQRKGTCSGTFTPAASTTAKFTDSPSSPVTGQAVSFDGAASTCATSPCTYAWTDAVDKSSLGSGVAMSFTFHDAGLKKVTLKVTDATGRSGTVEHDVNVGSSPTSTPAPTVTVTPAPTPLPTPLPTPSPQPAASAQVGAPTPAGVSCTTTLAVNASIQTALNNASPGQFICLAAGTWSGQHIASFTPSGVVTLAAQPGAMVKIGGLTFDGQTDNLVVEGLHFTSCLCIWAGANNVTITHDTLQGFSEYAIELCSGCHNNGPTITNITMTYNQIDHTFYCLRAATAGGNWNFSHNVCGPGIGAGGNNDAHYIQIEGNDNITVDNNAFEGPANAAAIAAGAHLNVSHQCGSNIEFKNNIVWHPDTVAQDVLWGDDCLTTGANASNNLFVEDPNAPTDTNSIWIEDRNYGPGANIVASNNTIIAGKPGSTSGGLILLGNVSNPAVAQNNIAVGAKGSDAAVGDIGDFAIGMTCTCSGNVADDGSGDINWVPSWQNESWTPADGRAWVAPPSNYYKPYGLAAAEGYQGAVGP